MRSMASLFVVALALMPSLASASSQFPKEKVKTGIHPSGGFYGIYEIECSEGVVANIASVQGNGRWCLNHEGELACFRRSRDASETACLMLKVAASQHDRFLGYGKQRYRLDRRGTENPGVLASVGSGDGQWPRLMGIGRAG